MCDIWYVTICDIGSSLNLYTTITRVWTIAKNELARWKRKQIVQQLSYFFLRESNVLIFLLFIKIRTKKAPFQLSFHKWNKSLYNTKRFRQHIILTFLFTVNTN